MNSNDVLKLASEALLELHGHTVDVLTLHKPRDYQSAIHLLKVISKLSPLIGNMLEASIVSFLNDKDEFKNIGSWIRQDPGFPDTIFTGNIKPSPGIEIKTWFPLATEITARFKDSHALLSKGNTNVAVIAWLPSRIIYGEPKIVGVWIDSAISLAKARDLHYHSPPHYLVFEPEDTSARTANLQQTNTNGYVFQGTAKQLTEAQGMVEKWGSEGKKYSYSKEYQLKLKSLLGLFPYRLDTNFAKIDRIEHPKLENFKTHVLKTKILGSTISEWAKMIKIDDGSASGGAIAKIMSD